MLEKALKLAIKMHSGQIDKSGEPYIYHPISVMEKVKGESEKIVAVLHDVVEDSPLTIVDLSHMGYPIKIVDAVDAITKRNCEHYKCYLDRIKANKIALSVKLADISSNTEPRRLTKLEDKEILRLIRKYADALEYLMEIVK